jgi:hypothetical protein
MRCAVSGLDDCRGTPCGRPNVWNEIPRFARNDERVPEGRGSLSTIKNSELRIKNSKIPICIEGNDPIFETTLVQWSNSIFSTVHKVNEKQRFAMHLAAVFANNFTNAMYEAAYQIFKENNLDWSLIFPLLENTLEKVKHNAPHLCQTGPAVRSDVLIMEKHCNAMDDEELIMLYKLVSKIIQKQCTVPI